MAADGKKDEIDRTSVSSPPSPDKLIEHLSREIETHSKLLLDWRTRAAFYWLLGPFVVIGSLLIASRGIPSLSFAEPIVVIASVVAALSFLTMGFIGAKLEEHIWNQCNKWRRSMARLMNDRLHKIGNADLEFDHQIKRAYMLAHGVLLVALIAILTILSRVVLKPPQ